LNELFSLKATSWLVSEIPILDIVQELFDGLVESSILSVKANSWQAADPLKPTDPIGPIRSLVTFSATDGETPVEIVPGSQGQPVPLTEVTDVIESVLITPKSSLSLDGRCWFRLSQPTSEIKIQYWAEKTEMRTSL
jgi:hypothetical protein